MVNLIYLQKSTDKYSDEHCTGQKDHEKRVMFINHLSRDSTDDCRLSQKFHYRELPRCYSLYQRPWQIPPENFKLHFPLIMKVSITNLGKYINFYFRNTTLHYTQLFNFYTNTSQRMASRISVLCTVSMLNPSHALLYYQFRWCSLSLEHKNDHDECSLRVKAKEVTLSHTHQ